MKPGKKKSLSEAKVIYGFPQNEKFQFCPVIALYYNFINDILVKFVYEDDVRTNWFLFW